MFVVKNLTCKINHIKTIFENISFTIGDNEKVAIVGKNGIGKSLLLQLMVGKLNADGGEIIKNNVNISYFPQKFNDLNFSSIADIFGFEKQVISLNRVEDDCADVEDYENLDGNWDCIDKIKNKMKFFGLNFDLLRDFSTLSGGEKVKLILSRIIDKNSNFLILDEPTNNMDYESRKYFYDFVRNWHGGLVIVSHDRELLNLVDRTLELRRIGLDGAKLFSYGGNYDYWMEQKKLEESALKNKYKLSIKNEEIKKQETIRTMERLKKGFAKSGRIVSDGSIKSARTLQEMNREKTALRQVANAKNRLGVCDTNIAEIQNKMELSNKIYFKFADNDFKNKNLVEISSLNFFYGKRQIFNDFELLIKNGDRIAINGRNGSGKSTLLNIIMGKIKDFRGDVRINANNVAYLDQNCDFLSKDKTILENIMSFNFCYCKEQNDKTISHQALSLRGACDEAISVCRQLQEIAMKNSVFLAMTKPKTVIASKAKQSCEVVSYPKIASSQAPRNDDSWKHHHIITEKGARDILAMFLFRTDEVFKKVADLSGGEKLRVALACIFSGNVPELILLDEPTNNMDLDSIEILENILNQYNGGLVVVSHDRTFKENIKINKNLELKN